MKQLEKIDCLPIARQLMEAAIDEPVGAMAILISAVIMDALLEKGVLTGEEVEKIQNKVEILLKGIKGTVETPSQTVLDAQGEAKS